MTVSGQRRQKKLVAIRHLQFRKAGWPTSQEEELPCVLYPLLNLCAFAVGSVASGTLQLLKLVPLAL